MFRRLFILSVCAFVLFCFSRQPYAAAPRRGLFVSVIQEPPVLSSHEAIEELVGYCGRAGVSDLFVQVYRANKSWFACGAADASPYFSCKEKTGGDSFALLIRRAHEKRIRVHAWLNLLSLSANAGAPILKKYGPSVLTRNLRPKRVLTDYMIDSQYFLEPGDPRVREELVSVVTGLLLLYPDLDGVQFDYIRYPDKHPFYGYTDANVERFKRQTGAKKVVEGSPEWSDWKRAQVTGLLETLVSVCRRLRPSLEVSTTGCAPYIRAYAEAFQDWPGWVKSGLVDFVTLMSYSSDVGEFSKFVDEAKMKVGAEKLNVAVGAYEKKYRNSFREQFALCERKGCRECVVFHYGDLKARPALAEALEEAR